MKSFTLTFLDPLDNEEINVTTDGIDLEAAIAELKEAGWQTEMITKSVEVKDKLEAVMHVIFSERAFSQTGCGFVNKWLTENNF